MADPSLLASIISGTNPLAPQMLGAYQGAQQAGAAIDPAYGHNEGPAGALAKTLLGFQGGNALRQGVQQTTDANTAAMPDLARLLANPDPYGQLAQGGVNPIAASRLLQGASPEMVGDARLKAAQAAIFGAHANFLNGAGVRPPSSAAPAAPAMGNAAPAALTSGVSTLRPTVASAGDLDPVSLAMMPTQQAATVLAQATPQQLAAYYAKLNKLKGGANAPGR
jgi:hypothetical protein